jgi:hypothetical protein
VESYIVTNASPKQRSTVLGIFYATSQHSTGILAPLLGYFFDLYGCPGVTNGWGSYIRIYINRRNLPLEKLQADGSGPNQPYKEFKLNSSLLHKTRQPCG